MLAFDSLDSGNQPDAHEERSAEYAKCSISIHFGGSRNLDLFTYLLCEGHAFCRSYGVGMEVPLGRRFPRVCPRDHLQTISECPSLTVHDSRLHADDGRGEAGGQSDGKDPEERLEQRLV